MKNKQDKLMAILLGFGIALCLFLIALAVSASAHGRHHGYPTPSLTPTPIEATPTDDPCAPIREVAPDAICETPSPSATPMIEEPTKAPEETHGDGLSSGSDGLHTAPDGLGCATHECTSPYDGQPVIWK